MFENALIAVNWSGTTVDAAAFARSLCVEDATLTLDGSSATETFYDETGGKAWTSPAS